MVKAWTKGRGQLGFMTPLLGRWQADADSEMGRVICTREFTKILNGKYIRLTAHWDIGGGAKTYDEEAIYGVKPDGRVGFWSFTSDGKNSEGYVAEMPDIPEAVFGFEAKMPAGLGRQAFWPDGEGGFHWVVEAKPKTNWKRFLEHHYKALD